MKLGVLDSDFLFNPEFPQINEQPIMFERFNIRSIGRKYIKNGFWLRIVSYLGKKASIENFFIIYNEKCSLI